MGLLSLSLLQVACRAAGPGQGAVLVECLELLQLLRLLQHWAL